MNSTLPTPAHLNPWFQCFSSLPVVSVQVLNFLVGLPLNLYIVRLLVAGGLDGSAIFPLSHALNDIFFVLPAPLYVLCYFGRLCFMPLLLYFCAFCLTSRFLIQSGVSLECYLAVVRPVVFRRYRHPRYRLAYTAAVWAYSMTACAVYVRYVDLVPHYILGLVQTACFTVKIFCCVSTLKVLRRPGPGVGRREDAEVGTVKRRALATVCVNLLAFLIQTLPLTAAFFIYVVLSTRTLVWALEISSYLYVAVGLVQTLFFLYQFGKLAPLCRPAVL